jgi:hypothetical protein
VILLRTALVVLGILLLLETRWGHWSPERWTMLLVAGLAALAAAAWLGRE